MNILQEMRQRRLFFDGGMGSLLQAKGLKAGELPERWNLTHPEKSAGSIGCIFRQALIL